MRSFAIGWLLFLTLIPWLLFTSPDCIVVDDMGPVAHASVGYQGQAGRVATDRDGRFCLAKSADARRIIAQKPGYRIASAPAKMPLTLRLERLPSEDNRDYAWIEPHPNSLQPNQCGNCHGEIYREWQSSAHARSATNPKFLHLFAGTDGKSPALKAWNARAEHPDGSAVCAGCHVPTLKSATLEYDVREAQGDARSGIHCDYCHKVAGVSETLGTRFGRDALELLRPATGDAIMYGPLDDAVRRGESFAKFPVYKDSRYCAACHEGIVFGVHAYSTYSEWLASPAKQRGQQCQDCHMAPTGTMTNIAPGKGGIERKAATLASHPIVGGEQGKLRQALSLKANARRDQASLRIDIEIVARRVGHRLPTGFADRQLLLIVQAFDDQMRFTDLLHGSKLPKSAGRWAGSAGALFAKQLTGEAKRTPSPFWLPVFGLVDTRLQPEQPVQSEFHFAQGARRVIVQLWYRRFWQEVADSRGWEDNDLLLHEIRLDCGQGK
jgi:hypothetical protein